MQKSKQMILVISSLDNISWVIRNWNSINVWQAIFCHFHFSLGDSILPLLLLFTVCMRLRGHSWKSSAVRHASGDKCFIWSKVYNQLFLSVEWKETEKNPRNLCRSDCLHLLSSSVQFIFIDIREGTRCREKPVKSSCGLAAVSGTNGFRTLFCLQFVYIWERIQVLLQCSP